MSSAKIRTIKTTLEEKASRPGGIRVRDALANADQNVEALADRSRDLVLNDISELIRQFEGGVNKPTVASLDMLIDRLNTMLSYCTAIKNQTLPNYLRSLCRLAEIVRSSDLWLPGTFGPVLVGASLIAQGRAVAQQDAALLAEVNRCIERYRQ